MFLSKPTQPTYIKKQENLKRNKEKSNWNRAK